VSELFTPNLLRQGSTLDLRHALSGALDPNPPSPLTITWSASGDAGEYNTDPNSGPVFPENGSREHTISANASRSADAPCNFALDGDANIVCTAAISIHLGDITTPIWDVHVDLVVSTTVTITPAGVVSSRTVVAGPQTLAGSKSIGFHGPSPASVNDPVNIPCTVPVGTHLSNSYSGFSSAPQVNPNTTMHLNVNFTGLGSPPDWNPPGPNFGGQSSTLNLSGPGSTVDLGAVQPDIDPPVANPGGDANHGYAGTEGTGVKFNGSGSADPRCGAPSLLWNFGDSSPTSTLRFPVHTYDEEGTYHGTLTATNAAGLSSTTPFTVTVADAALSSTGTSITATEGASFGPVVVASFSDADPNGTTSDYTATIDWGDGTSSPASIDGSGLFTASGSHTYAEEGLYDITVKVDDAGGSTTTAVTKATVADAALTATGFTFKSANPVNGTVANFTDADPNGTVSDYTATINWGDGSSSPGTVSGAGPFKVSGTHLYIGIGPYTIATHVCDTGGSCADTRSNLLLEYMTGRAFALSANQPLLPISPTPDTGGVKSSVPSTTTTPCAASVGGFLLTAHQLCANVTTALNPGISMTTASVSDATIGLLLSPVKIGIIQSSSTTTCSSSIGTTTIGFLKVGSYVVIPSPTPLAPNTTINLGVLKIVLNEQVPVAGADKGTTVNAVHITEPGLGSVVLASSTSDIHNCP
jgi:PKD repeat protein